MSYIQELKNLLQGEVKTDEKTLDTFSRDASLFQVKPAVVIAPAGTEDIEKLVSYVANRREEKLSITARSGGTDMTGGPLSSSIVLDMTAHFNEVKEIRDGYAIVQPGVFYRDFEKKTLAQNLLLPTYPASREICTLGGMVANNSGGEKSLVYGQTKDYVMEVKTILRDGKEYTFGPVSEEGVREKIAAKGLEGDIYEQVFRLVDDNYDFLQQAKPKVSKNSAGYLLWEVWDKKTFNLAKLFTGSQGTLGIITEAKVKLVTPKKHSKLLVIFLKDLKPLTDIVHEVLRSKPESFESFDDKTLNLTLRILPSFVKILGKNIFKLAWQFLPEFWMFVTGGIPKLILLAEFTGDSEAEVDAKAVEAEKALERFHIKTRITKTEDEARKYWTIRRESFNLLRHHVRDKQTAPFIDDMIVPPETLPQFLPELEEMLAPYHLTYSIAGHVGNGNFHIIPLMKLADPQTKKTISELAPKVYELVLKFHGSITGEHNDGLIRGPYLKQMYGEKTYELFQKTKHIFDPDDIFNPGKKVEADAQYAMAHLKTK